jgi:hypothetical protein
MATIRGKGRIDARINEKIRKIFRRKEKQSAQRGPCKSVTAEPRENVAVSRHPRKLWLGAVGCFETTRVG